MTEHYVPKANAPSPAEYLLKPYPLLTGEVLAGEQKRPLAAAEVRFYRETSRWKAEAGDDGTFQVHLPPGRYHYAVTKDPPTEETHPKKKPNSVMLQIGQFQIRDSDVQRSFEVAALASVNLRLSVRGAAGDEYPKFVATIDPKTKRLISSLPLAEDFDPDQPVKLYGRAGHAVLLAGPSEERGQQLGQVTLDPEKPESLEFSIEEWEDMEFAEDGRVVFGK